MVKNGCKIPCIFAKAGTIKRKSSKSGQQRFIKKVVLYDKNIRNEFESSHDIALLKTIKPFELGDLVKTIKWDPNVHYDEKATIYGWGATLKGSAKILQKKDLTLIQREKCEDMIKRRSAKLKDYEICTNESPCYGDSGGPLIQVINGKQMLIGITSWTYHNCSVPPTVFVFPGYFDAWLKQEIKKLE